MSLTSSPLRPNLRYFMVDLSSSSLIVNAYAALPEPSLDRTSARRRTPAYAAHDLRSRLCDCNNPESPPVFGEVTENPSGSMAPCPPVPEFAATCLSDVHKDSLDIPH